jgi:hypothetical protein
VRPLFLLLVLALTLAMVRRRGGKRTGREIIELNHAAALPVAINLEKKSKSPNKSVRALLKRHRPLLTFAGFSLFFATFLAKEHYADSARELRDALQNASNTYLLSRRLDLLAERSRIREQPVSSSSEVGIKDLYSKQSALNWITEAEQALLDFQIEYSSLDLLESAIRSNTLSRKRNADVWSNWLGKTENEMSALQTQFDKVENPDYDESFGSPEISAPEQDKMYGAVASAAQGIVSRIHGAHADVHGSGTALLEEAHKSYIRAERDQHLFKEASLWLFSAAFILAFMGAIFRIDGIVPI